MTEHFPYRLSDEGRTATWNPGLTRAPHVLVHVRAPSGEIQVRRSMNSGRARVREGEVIESISPEAV